MIDVVLIRPQISKKVARLELRFLDDGEESGEDVAGVAHLGVMERDELGEGEEINLELVPLDAFLEFDGFVVDFGMNVWFE